MRFLLVVLAALLVRPALAQPTNWLPPSRDAGLSLTAQRAVFNIGPTGNPFGATASAWTLGATAEVGRGVRLMGEVPFAFATVDVEVTNSQGDVLAEEARTGSALGAVQLGVEADPTPWVTVGGAVRLPTASEGTSVEQLAALSAGALTDLERPGAFASQAATLAGWAELRLRPARAVTVRLRALPQVVAPVADDAGDAEGYLGTAAQAFYRLGRGRVGGGVTAITALNGDRDGVGEVQVGVVGDVPVGPVRVGVLGRLAVLGDLRDHVEGAVGLSVSTRGR